MKTIAYHVIGVVKNFNFNSLREQVTPLALMLKQIMAAWLSVKHSPCRSRCGCGSTLLEGHGTVAALPVFVHGPGF